MLLTILIPCLNEQKTIAKAVQRAQHALQKNHLLDAEILVADNGSTDRTLAIVLKQKVARLINVTIPGYGAALDYGILHARGKFVLFADADLSYDFAEVKKFIPFFQKHVDLVLGSRFLGKIKPGAMPFLHRYLGTPFLTWLIRQMYGLPLTDCNSGMRLVRKSFYKKINMRNSGMEWASEILIRTALYKGRYQEVPITLHPDRRKNKPHLIPWSDGWRHLKAIILLKPESLLIGVLGFSTISLISLQNFTSISFFSALAATGLFLAWLAADLIHYAITQRISIVSRFLLRLPLVPIFILVTTMTVVHILWITLSGAHLTIDTAVLISLLMMANIWLFFIETIKTHFLYRLSACN